MRRSVVPLLALALTITTAVALLRTESVLTDHYPSNRTAQLEANLNASTVRRFYEAVNAMLRSGDTTPLERIVAPGFVDHAPFPSTMPNRAGLEQALELLRGADPTLSLTVDTLVANGDQVLAHASVHRTDQPPFPDLLPGPTPAAWSPFDLLRLQDGRIVERWGDASALELVQPLLEAPLSEVPPSPATLAITRLTVAPGAAVPPLVNSGPVGLNVEAGTVQVSGVGWSRAHSTPPGPATLPAGTATATAGSVLLAPGDQALLPPDTIYALRNDGKTPVEVLAEALFPIGPGAPRVDALFVPESEGPNARSLWPPGVTAVSVAQGVVRWSEPAAAQELGRRAGDPGPGHRPPDPRAPGGGRRGIGRPRHADAQHRRGWAPGRARGDPRRREC